MENRGVDQEFSKRPLSPHITIYRWPLNAIMSIMHRATGVGLGVGAIFVVWWFLAASISESYFNFVDGLLTSLLGDLIMVGLLAAIWYHFCNGIRHLIWDTGAGHEIRTSSISAPISLATALILTIGSLYLICVG